MSQDSAQCRHTITKEIRFAVVMYGGVSLAIYMNGIAQELLNMVNATSEKNWDTTAENYSTKSKGVSSVYSEIANYLASNHKANFRHRFIVDIISGTSAGGINGVCLAKGLARGLDNLKDLEKIWLEEGDLGKLLNDSESQAGRLCTKEPKTSLLNSMRMYAKLLEAFQRMELAAQNREPSENPDNQRPLIESLDLFVTATDLRGAQLPIQLSDGKIFENIHKHVFPFKYRLAEYDSESGKKEQPNHFTKKYDPLLAFASRCTSSFPTAFEPVKVAEVLDYLKKNSREDYKSFSTNLENWKHEFFRPYNASNGISLEEREFADGGYLDNRPFGHAIQAIHERESDCPLERKLLFIDPAPESDDTKSPQDQPKTISFLKNTTLAAFELPRYETIREEINFLQKRNRWISTVNQIKETLTPINEEKLNQTFYSKLPGNTQQIQAPQKKENGNKNREEITPSLLQIFLDNNGNLGFELTQKQATAENTSSEIKSFFNHLLEKKTIGDKPFAALDLDDLTKTYGSGYPSYHYTKIEKISDFLTLVISKAAGINEQSKVHLCIKHLVTAWRKENYFPKKANEKKTENHFIASYDIDFRIRRLAYFREVLEQTLTQPCDTDDGIFNHKNKNVQERLYRPVVDSIKILYALKKDLLQHGKKNPIYNFTTFLSTALQIESIKIDSILTSLQTDNQKNDSFPDFDTIVKKITQNVNDFDFKNEFNALMAAIGNRINEDSETRCAATPQLHADSSGTSAVRNTIEVALQQLFNELPEAATKLLFFYDYGYELQEITTFQLLAGGEYGEGTPINIHRISPLDATNLLDEKKNGQSKLAGIALGSFGGFLDREWRRNDILWGRLDGAERLISALIPDNKDTQIITVLHPEEQHTSIRQRFIDNAHHSILRESIDEWLYELQCTRFTSKRAEEQYKRLHYIRKALYAPAGKHNNHPNVNIKGEVRSHFISWKCRKEATIKRLTSLIDWILCSDYSSSKDETVSGRKTPSTENKCPDPAWKTVFQTTYDFHRELEPEPSLRYLGRSSGIISSMIDGLDSGEGITKKISSYLKKLNTILLGLLDISTPKSFFGVLFGYWVQLLFLLSIVLIFAGSLYRSTNTGSTLQNFGLVLLGIDLIVWAFKQLLVTHIHKITCNPCFRRLLNMVVFALTASFLFVLIVLYSTIITSWDEFIKFFMHAYTATLNKITAPFF